MNLEKSFDNEFGKIHENWQKLIKEKNVYDILKKYVIRGFTLYPNAKPTMQNILKPFKYVSPEDVGLIIIADKPEIDSYGFAYSSLSKLPLHDAITNELHHEFKGISDTLTKQTIDSKMMALASQGAFMPILNMFVKIGKPESDQIMIFWHVIFNELNKYSCMVYLVFRTGIEEFVNEYVKTEKGDDKPKPDDPINKYINCKIKALIDSTNFIGCGCFMRCNRYLKEYYKTPINWMNI